MKKFRIWNNDQWLDDAVVLSKDGKLVDALLTRKLDLTNAVVQYSTGLLDKNGREIYEGDVIKFSLDTIRIGLVKWNEDHACFEHNANLTPYYVVKYWDGEVIGNIFENPELVK